MTKFIKPIRRFTMKDMDEVIKQLKESDVIYQCNFAQLAKHTLAYFLPIPVFKVDFNELRKEYIKGITDDGVIKSDEKVPTDETQFYKYICDKYLWIHKEPYLELLDAYAKAISDLKEIDNTLSEIRADLDGIQKRNDLNEVYEQKPVYLYFQEHNQTARETVITFLKAEIKDYSLRKCFDKSIYASPWFDIPYFYRLNPEALKPKMPHDLDNKFRLLSIKEIRELKKSFAADRPAFNTFLHGYIREEEVIAEIYSRLESHHFLFLRSEVITEALKIYEHGAKIMFASAVPNIIEGMFHDMCVLAGEKEADLLKGGFQFKLDKLHDVLGHELYYEYYAFRFRIFRNKVAHGRLTTEDVNELSDLLLLDLHHACEMMRSMKFKLNQKLFVINQLIGKCDYEYLIEYIHLSNISVPDFYDQKKNILTIEKMIIENDFWEYLTDQVKDANEFNRHGAVATINEIAKRKPFDARCTKLYTLAGLKKPDEAMLKTYLENMRSKY